MNPTKGFTLCLLFRKDLEEIVKELVF